MIEELKEELLSIKPLCQPAMERAQSRWDHVAKPLKSLGILEEDIVRIAGIKGDDRVKLDKKALLILCSDNGVVEEGVTQTGFEVTSVVAEEMTRGRSSVCIMADCAGVDVYPVDMGTASNLDGGSRNPLINRKIAWGTRNFAREPAMTRSQAIMAVKTGVELVGMLKEKGYDIIATGEMGIGNTTTSSAVASILLKEEPSVLTGRGAGLNDEGLKRKVRVIEEAVERYGGQCRDAVDVLAFVGGFDIAGLAGVFLGGAIYRIPIIVDGFISGTAALAASYFHPEVNRFMLASHVSAEPAGKRILEELGLKPVIQAGMCLGEGTGAVAAMPLFSMALAVYQQMSTFEDISIEEYQPLGGSI